MEFNTDNSRIYQDLEGAFRSSLSLHDDDEPFETTSGNSGKTTWRDTDEEEEDLMEIDTTYELKSPGKHSKDVQDDENMVQDNKNIPQSKDIQERDTERDIQESKDDEDDEDAGDAGDAGEDHGLVSNISNSLILSPTSLGAHLALRTGRAKSRTEESDVDYEFDTSTMSRAPGNSEVSTIWGNPGMGSVRNRSSFAKADPRIFLANDDDDADTEDEQQMGQPYDNHAMNRFRNYFGNHPVQVHHHHYYYMGDSKKDEGAVDKLESPSSTHKQDPAPSTYKHENRELVDRDYDMQQIRLPSPWEQGIDPHARRRYMLMTYLQLAVNVLAIGYGSYLVSLVVSVIKSDVNHKLQRHASDVLVDIESCRRQYVENQCDPATIVPALEKQCRYWMKCMNQDPFDGGGFRASVSAETLGMIVNSLVEPLGFKFWGACAMVISVVFACNFMFGYLRAKSYYG